MRFSGSVRCEMDRGKDKDYQEYTDEELIVLSRGDPAATDFLMEKYKNLVRRKAALFRLPGADAEDLVQEGMLGLFKAVRDYEPGHGAAFSTFASLCIERQLYTAMEAAGRKKHQPLNEAVSFDAGTGSGALSGSGEFSERGEKSFLELLASEEADPEHQYISEENSRILEADIDEALSPLERRVLDLYLSDLDYVQIARRLGRDPKSTDNALQRIKAKVRKILRNK